MRRLATVFALARLQKAEDANAAFPWSCEWSKWQVSQTPQGGWEELKVAYFEGVAGGFDLPRS